MKIYGLLMMTYCAIMLGIDKQPEGWYILGLVIGAVLYVLSDKK